MCGHLGSPRNPSPSSRIPRPGSGSRHKLLTAPVGLRGQRQEESLTQASSPLESRCLHWIWANPSGEFPIRHSVSVHYDELTGELLADLGLVTGCSTPAVRTGCHEVALRAPRLARSSPIAHGRGSPHPAYTLTSNSSWRKQSNRHRTAHCFGLPEGGFHLLLLSQRYLRRPTS